MNNAPRSDTHFHCHPLCDHFGPGEKICGGYQCQSYPSPHGDFKESVIAKLEIIFEKCENLSKVVQRWLRLAHSDLTWMKTNQVCPPRPVDVENDLNCLKRSRTHCVRCLDATAGFLLWNVLGLDKIIAVRSVYYLLFFHLAFRFVNWHTFKPPVHTDHGRKSKN